MLEPRIVIVEDSALLREGLVRLLTDAGMEVIASCENAIGLVESLAADLPDVVLLDVRMPPTHTTEGLEAAVEIRSAFPDVGVLVLSQYLEPQYALRLLENTPGGVGYLLKDRVAESDDLMDSIRKIARGHSVIDSEVVDRLLNKRRAPSPIDQLSTKEREVLRRMASGASNAEIASEMFVTSKTVSFHIGNIFAKLGLSGEEGHRRVRAALEWLREN